MKWSLDDFLFHMDGQARGHKEGPDDTRDGEHKHTLLIQFDQYQSSDSDSYIRCMRDILSS